jgi:hypothetical protein
MRRSFGRYLAISLLMLAMIVPASAAPRRDDGVFGGSNLLQRIIQVVKFAVGALDDIKANIPTP